MSNLYVIVHEGATKEDREVRREILRIKREENFILVDGNPTVVNYQISEDSIYIGHSLGAAFVLNFLEKHMARAAFLIAPVWSPLENKFDKLDRKLTNITDHQSNRLDNHEKRIKKVEVKISVN